MEANNKRAAKTKLLQSIQRAYQIAIGSRQQGIPLHEYNESQFINRRQFLNTTGKATLFTAAAGASFLAACSTKSSPTIAIVGAGVAGLNAAYHLKRAGIFAQIYEASDRTGGRIITATDIMGKGLTTEMGGEFIDSTHTELLRLIDTFHLPKIDTFVESETSLTHACYLINGKLLNDKEILELFYPYAPFIQKDIDLIGDVISYRQHNNDDVRLDQLSLAEYLTGLGISGDLYTLLDVAYTAEYGCEIEKQSAINFLMLMDPGMRDEFNYSGYSDERYKVKGGNQQITDALGKRLEAQLNYRHQLEAIYRSDEKGKTILHFKTDAGVKEITADFVILALPFTILRNVELKCGFNPVLTKAITEMGYGNNAKFFMGFTKHYWRELGYTGFSFSNTHMQNGWDNSQLQEGEGAGYTIFTGGKSSDILNAYSDQEIAAQMLPVLESCFPGIQSAHAGRSARFHWGSSPFSKASYACFAPGQYTSFEGIQREASGNIYFAGEHCSYDFQGFMNGAAETGKAAALAVLQRIGIHFVF
jgi:monoamine oxidase